MKLEPNHRNIVVIGASAGGVEALRTLLQSLPDDFPGAVMVVLHVPAHTPSQLHNILGRVTALNVVAAEDGMALEPGTVYIARADRHLMLDASGIRLTRGPKECRSRPAIDVLFRSAAQAYGPRVVGVVLSGMLDDGTAGAWAIKDAGGVVLVQEPSEAMHDAMAESVIHHVKVDLVGTCQGLAEHLTELAGTSVETDVPPLMSTARDIENQIAMEGNGLQAGVMGLGEVSKYTCPDCHGVLVQINEGSIVRFRCHTGHAFSLMTLITEVNAAIDTGLWSTLRAIEERIMLLGQMADLLENANDAAGAAKCRQQAQDAGRKLVPIRELVLDAHFFGHDSLGE